jgi:hypothetical protein
MRNTIAPPAPQVPSPLPVPPHSFLENVDTCIILQKRPQINIPQYFAGNPVRLPEKPAEAFSGP